MRHLSDMRCLRRLRLHILAIVRNRLSAREHNALPREAVSKLHKHLQAPNFSFIEGDFLFGDFDKIRVHKKKLEEARTKVNFL